MGLIIRLLASVCLSVCLSVTSPTEREKYKRLSSLGYQNPITHYPIVPQFFTTYAFSMGTFKQSNNEARGPCSYAFNTLNTAMLNYIRPCIRIILREPCINDTCAFACSLVFLLQFSTKYYIPRLASHSSVKKPLTFYRDLTA